VAVAATHARRRGLPCTSTASKAAWAAKCTCSSVRARHSSRVSAAMIVVSFLGDEERACRAFPRDSYRWTDIVHVPCQRSPSPEPSRPGAWPPAVRRPAMCSEGGGCADHTGRPCQYAGTCPHAGMADDTRGRVSRNEMDPPLCGPTSMSHREFKHLPLNCYGNAVSGCFHTGGAGTVCIDDSLNL
jgi:hypothetical protein